MCCLQEVRWRGQGALFLGMRSRRYKLWRFGNSDGTGGVGVLVKEELCEKVVEVRRRSDRVKFRECGKLLNSKRFSLKLKRMVYWSCLRSAMLYGSETSRIY